MTPVLEMLAQRPRNYILEFIDLVKTHNVESVYIFGSQIKGFSTSISDIDLFVIVPDAATKTEIESLHEQIRQLEEHYGYRKSETIEQKFLNKINERIGMFLCHYIWKKKDFTRGKLHKIYGVSPLSILAPSTIILSTVFPQMKLVYGKELRSEITLPKAKKTELLKSLLCNMLLSTAQLPFSIVSRQATKYSLESIKWSLYSCSVIDDVREIKLKEIALYYSKHFSSRYLERIFALRENYVRDFLFTFATPYYVAKLHLLALLR